MGNASFSNGTSGLELALCRFYGGVAGGSVKIQVVVHYKSFTKIQG